MSHRRLQGALVLGAFLLMACTGAPEASRAATSTARPPRPTFTAAPSATVAPPAPSPASTATASATPERTATTEPTATPAPSATAAPSSTPAPTETAEPTATLPPATSTPEPPTATPPPTAPPPLPTVAPPAPTAPLPAPVTRQGGEWDFDGGYVLWQNPFGEPCAGGALAAGWNAFLVPGQFGSSCFNENKFGPNIQSGARSQEITFESIDGIAGLWRTFETTPGYRYRVSAWGIWHESPSPVILELGIDPAGGQAWDAGSVRWTPWGSPAGSWQQATTEFVATGPLATVFLKASHPIAPDAGDNPLRGGATLFDNVSVVELGPAG